MKLSTAVHFIICAFFAFSCGKSSSGGKNPQQNNEKNEQSVSTVQSKTTVSSFKIERRAQESDLEDVEKFKRGLNLYYFRLEISNPSEDTRVSCYRLVFNQRYNEITATPDSNNVALISTEILNSDPNEIEFECLAYDADKLVFEKEFKLFKSFVVEGRKSLSELGLPQNGKVGVLFFDKNSTLHVKNKNLHLEVEELISIDGTVTTYLEEDTINKYDDSIGLPGANIHIKTDKASGQLNVLMRGMNGGRRSTSPKDKTERLPADPKLNGKCRLPSSGLNKRDSRCFGKKGHRGVKGEKGYSGFPGGDTGELKLEINEETDLKLNVKFIPGKGSPGSKGGKGGFGSPGGKGQTLKWTVYGGCGREGPCNANDESYTYPHGAEGDRGPDGDEGEPGADGKIIPAELIIAGEITKIENDWNN